MADSTPYLQDIRSCMDLEDLSQEEIQVIMEQIEEEIILDEEMSEDDDDGVIDEGGDTILHNPSQPFIILHNPS